MENSHIEWTDHTFNPWKGCDFPEEVTHWQPLPKSPAPSAHQQREGE
jgi:hypothetical protein